MIEPEITATDEEDDYTSQASIIGTEDKANFCTPPLFFTVAALLIFFLFGSNLFMFVNANVGGAAGLEVTDDAETAVSTYDEPHIIRRAVNESEADDHESMVLMKPTGVTKNPAGLKGGGSAQVLRSRSLVCVLGGPDQGGGDTFLNDGGKVTQQLLHKAAKAAKTSYGIHVPFKKLSKVMDDLMRRRAQN
ncbi:hypothetical protein MTO96_047007, partial [Rhipicephalus appendiculatus]